MYGTLEQRDNGRWQLRFVRRLGHPVEKVWRAVTEPEHLAQWFPSTVEGDRRPGASLRFAFPGGVVDPIEGEMLAYEPPGLMELRWGTDVLRIELRAVDGGTELTLTDVLDDMGKGVRDGAGWHTCLDALEAALGGSDAARDQLGRWPEVQARYAERFPPEAAVIGPPEGLG
jgi:uncharacterized protein YndB with AHSA1/START domain